MTPDSISVLALNEYMSPGQKQIISEIVSDYGFDGWSEIDRLLDRREFSVRVFKNAIEGVRDASTATWSTVAIPENMMLELMRGKGMALASHEPPPPEPFKLETF